MVLIRDVRVEGEVGLRLEIYGGVELGGRREGWMRREREGGGEMKKDVDEVCWCLEYVVYRTGSRYVMERYLVGAVARYHGAI